MDRFNALGRGAQIMLVGAILLFGAVGYALDRWIATAPWFLLAGLATGIVVGGYEVITASRRS